MRPVIFLSLALLSVLLTSSAWPQQGPTRLALIIGNSAYQSATAPLPTAKNDARALADELRRSGFDIDLKLDLGKADMQGAIDAFANRIGTGMTALFYFSGFGVQVERQSYLMPVNVDSYRAEDVRRDGVSLDSIITAIHRRGAKVKIIIIDAARRNPFERRFRSSAEGLASPSPPENTLALYSAVPGQVIADRSGTNSVFMSELIKEIRAANVGSAGSANAENVFNHLKIGVNQASNGEQVPWVASSLVEELYFDPRHVPSQQHGGTTHQTKLDIPKDTPLPYTLEVGLTENVRFRECASCPEMVVVPEGEYTMGSPEDERDRSTSEGPPHPVKIPRRFAVGKLKITRYEFESFIKETGYSAGDRCWTVEDGKTEERIDRSFRNPGFEQDSSHPVVCINWDDANAYVTWLSKKTGKPYRLLSESEWEYVARAGTKSPFWWGSSVSSEQANYEGAGKSKTVPADMFKPNPWGLYQVSGHAFEWVEDCWNENYQSAPGNDWVRLAGNCTGHVRRAGAWNTTGKMLRSAYREWRRTTIRGSNMGVRVARTLAQ